MKELRKIAVMDDYLSPHHKVWIDEAAQRYGFAVDYYATAAEAMPKVREYEIFFGHTCAPLLKEAKDLKWFANVFAGIDPYLPDEVWGNPDCLFTSSAGAYGVAISEHIIMVLLMLLHRMPEFTRQQKAHVWQRLEPTRSMYGLRVTIVGMGDTGSNVARRAKAMGAAVCGVRRSLSKAADPAFDEVHTLEELDEILTRTDALVLCLPATPATRGLINEKKLALLPKDAFVVNTGRGAVVKTDAILAALENNELAGAALDVLEQEPPAADSKLWDLPNLILTPHSSGDMSLVHTCDRVVEMFLEDWARYMKGEPLRYVPDRKAGY